TYALQIGDVKIGAVVAVNCFGDVIDPATGKVIAGVYDQEAKAYLNSEQLMLEQYKAKEKTNRFKGNTSIGAVLTNVKLTKAQANKIASIAHDGFATTMRPSHTLVDGDTIFALSTNQVEAELNVVGLLAVKVI